MRDGTDPLFTWQQGLDRLALGWLLPDGGGLSRPARPRLAAARRRRPVARHQPVARRPRPHRRPQPFRRLHPPPRPLAADMDAARKHRRLDGTRPQAGRRTLHPHGRRRPIRAAARTDTRPLASGSRTGRIRRQTALLRHQPPPRPLPRQPKRNRLFARRHHLLQHGAHALPALQNHLPARPQRRPVPPQHPRRRLRPHRPPPEKRRPRPPRRRPATSSSNPSSARANTSTSPTSAAASAPTKPSPPPPC